MLSRVVLSGKEHSSQCAVLYSALNYVAERWPDFKLHKAGIDVNEYNVKRISPLPQPSSCCFLAVTHFFPMCKPRRFLYGVPRLLPFPGELPLAICTVWLDAICDMCSFHSILPMFTHLTSRLVAWSTLVARRLISGNERGVWRWKYSWILRHVYTQVGADVSKELPAFFLRIKQSRMRRVLCKDESPTITRKVSNCLSVDMAQRSWRLSFWGAQMWGPEQVYLCVSCDSEYKQLSFCHILLTVSLLFLWCAKWLFMFIVDLF